MPWLLYFYLSGSVFLVSFTAPIKQLPSVKSMSESFDHLCSMNEIYELTPFYEEKILFCFKQIPLNLIDLN